MNINSNNSEMQLDYTLKDVNIDSEVPKINISTKNNIEMQTKSDINFNISNIVKIKPILEDLDITPSTEEQNFKSEKDGFNNVKVNAVDNNIDDNIKPENIKEGINILGIEGNVVELNGEEKTVTPKMIQQTILPSEDKNAITKVTVEAIKSDILNIKPSEGEQNFTGLFNSVNVEPIPYEYIIPIGNIDITENGVYDVTDKATATVNIVDGNEVYY